ncbi:MAG: NAD(P)/FAD-dependent oxidoreductase [Candidatus Eisenbacteria bacterium]|nr:NAD(P)/FAD-dependent oxidoreductase [Candidatus Eisenbacteria bacterium]
MSRPRVVIIGGGFGGIAVAQGLAGADVDIMVIDRSNHFVFQPLLYQVASGTLAPSDIAVPIRWYLRRQKNTSVLLGDVTGIDTVGHTVEIDGGIRREPWDFLVLAAGSRHAYFGHGEWEPRAPGLKTLEDALEMRSRFLMAFEQAELTLDEAARRAWQTIVIVGGGPTGVELAGIMITMARKALRPDFRRIDTAATRILLVEGGARLLANFPEDLAEAARRDLEQMGVEIRLNTLVSDITPESARLGEETIATRTVFWAAGNAASPLSKMLGVPTRPNGQIDVEPDLSLPGRPDIFVIGDIAATRQGNGRPVPGVCQGAMQGGARAADNIRRTLAGRERRPFRYWNKGDMATIGRHSAVADLGFIRFSGWFAWLLWLFIHIMYLAGFRNRVAVFLEWGWEYLTYQKGVRLILGRGSSPPPRV